MAVTCRAPNVLARSLDAVPSNVAATTTTADVVVSAVFEADTNAGAKSGHL